MKRRSLVNSAAAVCIGCISGCLTNSTGQKSKDEPQNNQAPFEHSNSISTEISTNGDFPPNQNPSNGQPPQFDNSASKPEIDTSEFETLTVNCESIKLAPISVVYQWYMRSELRLVDARGLSQYKRSHIYGAVLSTAQKGSTGGPIENWPTDTRIVTYCGCPHHLSSIRAAGLQKSGYTDVYAIDEGFRKWSKQDYPMSGTTFNSTNQKEISSWRINGRTDPNYAGEYAWAWNDDQYEAAPIQSDGSFTIHLRFPHIDDDSLISVSTPEYTTQEKLGKLSNGVLERKASK